MITSNISLDDWSTRNWQGRLLCSRSCTKRSRQKYMQILLPSCLQQGLDVIPLVIVYPKRSLLMHEYFDSQSNSLSEHSLCSPPTVLAIGASVRESKSHSLEKAQRQSPCPTDKVIKMIRVLVYETLNIHHPLF